MSKMFENSPHGQGLVVPRTKKAMGMRCTGPPAKFELEKICTKARLLQRVALGMTWDNLDDLNHSWFSMRNAYEYYWMAYEWYTNDLDEKGVTQHLQLLFVICCVLHFAGRVAKDSVGGKWKGLRCVHHRLRSPWTKIHRTNLSVLKSRNLSNLSVFIDFGGCSIQFLLDFPFNSWVSSVEMAKHFHREDFSIALREAGDFSPNLPSVNDTNIAMENHHFLWEDPLFNGHFQ